MEVADCRSRNHSINFECASHWSFASSQTETCNFPLQSSVAAYEVKNKRKMSDLGRYLFNNYSVYFRQMGCTKHEGVRKKN